MQITLNQDEIEQAIDAFVRNQISIAENQKVTIDLKAGRGESGFSAILDITAVLAKAPAKKPFQRAAAPSEPKVTRGITKTPEAREEPEEPGETISETSPESTSKESPVEEAPIVEEKPAAEKAPAPARKGSIFNFAEKNEAATAAE